MVSVNGLYWKIQLREVFETKLLIHHPIFLVHPNFLFKISK